MSSIYTESKTYTVTVKSFIGVIEVLTTTSVLRDGEEIVSSNHRNSYIESDKEAFISDFGVYLDTDAYISLVGW